MPNFVASAEVDLLNGVLKSSIPFSPDLNLICGENGTLKTKLLQAIKGGAFKATVATPAPGPRIQAISPKRNSVRRAVESIIQVMRRENKNFDTYVNERGGVQINDATFSEYPSLGDLFYYVFERLTRDGASQCDHMTAVTADFNAVVAQVFPEYLLVSEWNQAAGVPRLLLRKRGTNDVPLEALSLGEQEVLSLILNLYASRDMYDVFLIDEPEVHLNWHLEERLFGYLDRFSQTYQRQVIAATHSRVVFKPEFLPKALFFVWTDDNHIMWTRELQLEQRRRIAGEAIEVLQLGDFPTNTAFVEDNETETIVRALADQLREPVSVVRCGNRPNVRSLYRKSVSDGSWASALFIEDGDNEGNPFPSVGRFLHLEKCAVENYLLDLHVMAAVAGKSGDECQAILYEVVLASRERIVGKTKFLAFLMDQLLPAHLTPELLAKLDASVIMPKLLTRLGLEFDDYVLRYVREAETLGVLGGVFPEALLNWLRGGPPA